MYTDDYSLQMVSNVQSIGGGSGTKSRRWIVVDSRGWVDGWLMGRRMTPPVMTDRGSLTLVITSATITIVVPTNKLFSGQCDSRSRAVHAARVFASNVIMCGPARWTDMNSS